MCLKPKARNSPTRDRGSACAPSSPAMNVMGTPCAASSSSELNATLVAPPLMTETSLMTTTLSSRGSASISITASWPRRVEGSVSTRVTTFTSEGERTRRREPAGDEVQQGATVAQCAAGAIDVWLGSQQPDQIGGDVPAHQEQRPLRRAGALAHEIDRIGDLRVAEAHPRLATALHAQMHPERRGDLQDASVAGEATAEIDIFEPAVQWEVLVENKPMLANRSETDSHVASVCAVDVRGGRGTLPLRLGVQQDRDHRGRLQRIRMQHGNPSRSG